MTRRTENTAYALQTYANTSSPLDTFELAFAFAGGITIFAQPLQ